MFRLKKNNPLVIFIVVAGLLLFLHGVGAIRPLENLLLYLTKPASSRLYAWGSSFRRSFEAESDQAKLVAQVDALSREVARLTVLDSKCAESEAENQKLRTAWQFFSLREHRPIAAGIIAKESSSDDSRGLLIDKGSKDGIRSGLAVVSEEGIVVGKILEVKDTTARVCLTTSPDCQLAAAIQNQNKTQGITDGDLGLTIKMNYIPQLEKIAVGDIVISSGLGSDIPRGLVIGRISQVRNESNEVWQEATIEPMVNFNDLTVVYAIIP
jgi:rod shape-determining protein MreC